MDLLPNVSFVTWLLLILSFSLLMLSVKAGPQG